MDEYYCSIQTPTISHFFDFSFAPALLFYSYIPIILISLLFGIFVLRNDNRSIRSKLFFMLSTVFFFLILNEIIQWVAVYARVVYLGWELVMFFRISVVLLSAYFVYNFIYKKDLSFIYKIIFSLIYLSVLFLTPTSLNITQFDLSYCEGVPGILWDIVHSLELLAVLWIVMASIYRYRQKDVVGADKRQIVLISLATCLFLIIFFVSNAYADLTTLYEVGLLGPIGMVVFLGFLTYMIVRFKVFNIKLIGAQVLIWILAILIGSQLFFIEKTSNFILTGITLSLSILFGGFLVRSVKREIEQSIRLKKLTEDLATTNEDLAVTNKGQENLIHIMNHQIKGYIGTAKNIFSELGESETYGVIPEKAKPLLITGLKKMDEGLDYIQTILKGESAQSGSLPYSMVAMDLKSVIEKLVSEQKTIAEEKGLSLDSKLEDGDYNITGDVTLLTESFKNLITNSIKYTETGSIFVSMSRSDKKILWSIKDTGRGISAEDGEKLFKPGGMGKDSLKYNIEASGYGLAFVKPVVEKHNGRIWYESEVGKGSTFYVELPVA